MRYNHITMDSKMLKRLKEKNPDKEYPSSIGKLWTKEEEDQLLREIANNMDNQTIADNHERTIGGIVSRIKYIAIKMHTSNNSIENIIETTKLDMNELMELIRKNDKRDKKNSTPDTSSIITNMNIENEILDIKLELVNINKNMEKIFKLLETLELVE
jgi:hypothetical protein